MVFSVNKDAHNVWHFMNMIVASNNVRFKVTKWETQHQQTDIDWDNVPYWNDPKYRLNQWDIPIPRAKSVQNTNLNAYDIESPMRGTYMLVRLEYLGTDFMWVREVITKLTLSKV